MKKLIPRIDPAAEAFPWRPRVRYALACALLCSGCVTARPGAQLSESDALYRLAILQLADVEGGPAGYSRNRALCIGVADDRGEVRDPSSALLASVRARIPRAVAATECPRTPRESASLLANPPWLVLTPNRRDTAGVESFGWNQPPGFGGICTVQASAAPPRVACIGI